MKTLAVLDPVPDTSVVIPARALNELARILGDTDEPIEILYIDEASADRQLAKLEALRRTRDRSAVERALDSVKRAATSRENVMPPILDAVRAYATFGSTRPHRAGSRPIRTFSATVMCGQSESS